MSIHRCVEFSWRRHSPTNRSGSALIREGPVAGSFGGGSGSGRSAWMLYHFVGRSSSGSWTTTASARDIALRKPARVVMALGCIGIAARTRRALRVDAVSLDDFDASGRHRAGDLFDRD